jgi:predicted exporter
MLALLWALLVLACSAHLAHTWFSGTLAIDTDVMSLLPRDDRNATAEAALEKLSAGASRRVLLVLAGADRDSVRGAATTVDALLSAQDSPLQALAGADSGMAELVDFYAPYRDRLLDRQQRARLQTMPPERIARDALQALYRPGVGLRALGPIDDPSGSFSAWLGARAAMSAVRPEGRWLTLDTASQVLIILPFELRETALSVASLERLQPVLASARALAAAAGVELLSAGVPVHAAAAATRATAEMSVIGLGAAAGIALMMLLCFRSPWPMLLVLGSVSSGLIVALSLSLLLFERVHLITLVFGASLVGVAEDYAIHFLSAHALASSERRPGLSRALLPGLLLAFATSTLGYLALALAPFPGLKQMAYFSIVGLLAALMSVLLWFPSLVGTRLKASAVSLWLAQTRRYWPTLRWSAPTLILGALILTLLGFGLTRLQVSDDLRALQSSPASLIEQQARISRWLAEPSPVQFYLVRAADQESLLQREEALAVRLDALVDAGFIDGHRALSDWVPSIARQQADARLLAPANTASAALLVAQLGASAVPARTLADGPLTLDAWLAAPVSSPLRPLWLGQLDGSWTSVVQVAGLNSPAQLPRLTQLAQGLDGVVWVDKIADYSRLLHDYRRAMTWVLAISFVLIFALLLPRFGLASWRVLAPTLCALLVVLSWLGWHGEPLQLFHVLGLTVMLGMCVDYGIFLMEPAEGDAPWLAVVLGAVNTLLAFGLLAFSQTPALAAFGSTLLIGITVAWLLAPTLCRPNAAKE